MPSHQARRDPLPPDYQCPTHGVDCDCPSCRKAESFFSSEADARASRARFFGPMWEIAMADLAAMIYRSRPTPQADATGEP